MNFLERRLQALAFQKRVGNIKTGGRPQPHDPIAHVILGCLTPAGLSANGKGSKQLFPAFCLTLRELGFATHICTSHREVERRIDKVKAAILINVFGEDHNDIASPHMIRLESKATAVFNRAQMGAVIADKQRSLEHFTKFGVPMPPQPSAEGLTFSNARTGTARTVNLVSGTQKLDEGRYNRAMINTVQAFEGRSYHTTVRLMCVADQIVHAMVRARPVEDENPSVHNKDTPLDPQLLGHLQQKLVNDQLVVLQQIARNMNDAIGPCFVAHDILFDQHSGDAFVCEAGLKFFDQTFQKHILPVRKSVSFHELLFDERRYAQKAADLFVDWVKSNVLRS